MTKPNRKTLQTLAQRIDITRFIDYRDYLKTIYQKAKAEITPYSYLEFASDLSFSKSNVIRLIIAGERPLTDKSAAKIARALELKGPARRYFTHLVKYHAARLPKERDRLFNLLLSYRKKSQPAALDPKMIEYYKNWYNPIIREMVGLEEFKGDPAWIQKRLSFSLRLEEVKKALELLADIGIVDYDSESGRYERSGRMITDPEVDGMAIILYHQKMIEMAKEAITSVAPYQREIRAVTVALPEKAIPELKQKILDWSMAVMDLEESHPNADGVYQVNFQMFPFTKQRPTKGKT